MSAEIQDLSQHHGGHGGIWIFGHRVPTPLLLVGAGGGVLLLFWAMRKKSATGTADSAAGAGQNMPTPPGGPGTDFGFSGYDPVTGLPIPAGASTGAALGGLDPGTGVSSSQTPMTGTDTPQPASDVAATTAGTFANMSAVGTLAQALSLGSFAATAAGGLTSSPPAGSQPAQAAAPASASKGYATAAQQAQQQKNDAQHALVHSHPTPTHPTQTGLERLSGPSRSLVEQRVGSVTHGPPPGITGARATQDRKGVGPSTGRGVMTPAEAAAHYRALGIASSGVMQRTQALIDAQKKKPKPVPKPKQKPPKSQAHVIAPRRV